MITPDLATAILSKEPPSAARCSAPIFVMTDAAKSELVITLVASRAPPSPAYRWTKEIRTIYHFIDLNHEKEQMNEPMRKIKLSLQLSRRALRMIMPSTYTQCKNNLKPERAKLNRILTLRR